jgi:FkbM family methyltransferase
VHVDVEAEYDLPALQLPPGAVVLDIGANVGLFSEWAVRRWPGCSVIAYEPHPANAQAWRVRMSHIPELRFAELVERAVVAEHDCGASMPLYEGANNCGECSLLRGYQQTSKTVTVGTLCAACLPRAEVLKLDTEGMEWPILRDYPHLAGVRGAVYEWHDWRDRWRIGGLLAHEGLELVADHVMGRDRGIMRWMRGGQ